MPLVVGLEHVARGGVLPALATDYARAFLVLIALRARLGDMISARAFACEELYSSKCISCSMDMKDGSRQAWAAVPARGVLGEWPWASEFVAQRAAAGCVFLEFKCSRNHAGDVVHGSAVALAEPAAKHRVESAWASMLEYVAQAQRVPASLLADLRLTGHAPRHVFPSWAAKFNWSRCPLVRR